MSQLNLPRRTFVQGTAWAVPGVMVASAAPAFAQSAPQVPGCAPTSAVPVNLQEPPEWTETSLRLSFSRPTRMLVGSTGMAVPLTLTVANVGPTALPEGTRLVITAWTLDTSGRLDKSAATLISTQDMTTLDATGADVTAWGQVSATTNVSTFSLTCPLVSHQQLTADVTWELTPGAFTPDLTQMQFLARIITNPDPLNYTEFQTPEVIGGTAVL